MTELIAPVCWPCIVGLHEECYQPIPIDTEPEGYFEEHWSKCCCHLHKGDDAEAFALGVGRPTLDPKDITDITSTGRKRAAQLYPILEGMECEWAGLLNAGGGIRPIVGCAGNLIYSGKGPDKGDRHHGPDKNVINNAPDNVHRICSTCHNRWHAANNRFYGSRPPADQPFLPVAPEGETLHRHDRDTLATPEDREQSDYWWSLAVKDRIELDD